MLAQLDPACPTEKHSGGHSNERDNNLAATMRLIVNDTRHAWGKQGCGRVDTCVLERPFGLQGVPLILLSIMMLPLSLGGHPRRRPRLPVTDERPSCQVGSSV